MTAELPPETLAFYQAALRLMKDAGIPYLLGGAYALGRYTGIERHTKDLDVHLRPADVNRALAAFAAAGYTTERSFPHWLAKVYHGDAFVDLIYRSGNGLSEVDDDWFRHADEDEVLGERVLLAPPEEVLWCKAFIQERERYDGADVAHLIRARGDRLDWDRLVRRFGPHWRVLLGHLVLFGYIYPGEASKVPDLVLRGLTDRLAQEGASDRERTDEKLCRGTLLSREQYLIDLGAWGYRDARVGPGGTMTDREVELWTAAIAEDGSASHVPPPPRHRL